MRFSDDFWPRRGRFFNIFILKIFILAHRALGGAGTFCADFGRRAGQGRNAEKKKVRVNFLLQASCGEQVFTEFIRVDL
jgi:hypothetical protein